MGTPYIGEIRMFGGNFAPAGWAFCDGQLVSISENDALFSLIGTTYGGDGQETFALPDLRGRIPVHMGTGPGLSTHIIGQNGGTEQVTLTTNQIPSHTHTLMTTLGGATQNSATGNILATTTHKAYVGIGPAVAMGANSIDAVGGSQPHDNMMPYLSINFIISLYGIYPSQI